MAEIGLDLGEVFDAHLAGEFATKDLAATMATMTGDPFVNHVPTMMGGVGAAGVADFYRDHFIGHWPDDTVIVPVSGTVGVDTIVDEMVISFTHNTPMDALRPGIEPTGRPVTIAAVAVVGFDDDKVAFEHVNWDQASVLDQVGPLHETALR